MACVAGEGNGEGGDRNEDDTGMEEKNMKDER